MCTKIVVSIRVCTSNKNIYSSNDFNGYVEFFKYTDMIEFIQNNNFEINEIYSNDKITLVYLKSFEYNHRIDEIKKSFIPGLSDISKQYWKEQREIENMKRKIEGYVYCKELEDMMPGDYAGKLKDEILEYSNDYLLSNIVAGYFGSSHRKIQYDEIINQIIDSIELVSIENNSLNKYEIISSWLRSGSARRFMDEINDIDSFAEKLNSCLNEIFLKGYIYTLKEHDGSLYSTINLSKKLEDGLKIIKKK